MADERPDDCDNIPKAARFMPFTCGVGMAQGFQAKDEKNRSGKVGQFAKDKSLSTFLLFPI